MTYIFFYFRLTFAAKPYVTISMGPLKFSTPPNGVNNNGVFPFSIDLLLYVLLLPFRTSTRFPHSRWAALALNASPTPCPNPAAVNLPVRMALYDSHRTDAGAAGPRGLFSAGTAYVLYLHLLQLTIFFTLLQSFAIICYRFFSFHGMC